jgi:hypothetical protein
MKKLLSKFLIAALISATFLVSNPPNAQAGGSIYLSPGAQSISQGSTFYVSVRVNTGSSIDAVQANLSYPTDKLDYLGISYGGTAFEIQAQSSGGGGSIKIGRGTLSPKSGDRLVATISFRAKVGSGSASVSFTGGTEAVSGGKVVTSSGSGATYSFTEAAAPPKPKPKDKTAPKISDIKVANLGLNAAVITWKTNEKSSSIVAYGPSEKLGIVGSSTKLVKSHKIALSSKLLFPGTKYFYQVKSKDAAGNEAKSKVASFKTKGYKVRLKIVDSDGNPVVGAQVKLVPGEDKVTTDENGIANFENVSSGEHSVHIQVRDQALASSIDVSEDGDPGTVQEFDIKVAAATTFKLAETQNLTAFVIAAIAFAIVLASFAFWRIKRPKKHEAKAKTKE